MSFVSRNRFLLSTSARLSAVYAGLLVIAFALMGAAVVLITSRMTTYELRGPLTMETAFVREVIETEGLQHAISDIDLRTAHSVLLLHRLDDGDDRLLAGDPAMPHLPLGWSHFDVPRREDGRGGRVFALTEAVGGGARLTVGVETRWANSVRDATLRTIALLGAIVFAVALAIGLVWTNVTFRRMRALWQALRSAGAGDFHAHAPVRDARSPDDIDALALRFNEMVDRIDGLVASIRRVSTNVAHDLRKPLDQLRLRLDRALAAGALADAHSEILAAKTKTDDILRTFDAMLHLAEIETGALRAGFSPTALAPLVERVTDAYRPEIEESGGVLISDVEPDVAVLGDPALLARILSNLLDNAIRHAAAGPRVTVVARHQGDDIVIAVEDDGPGVPVEARERLLKPFERLDESRSTPGSGLGLSIVAAIAQLHGARLAFQDAAPGLRVTLTFAGTI